MPSGASTAVVIVFARAAVAGRGEDPARLPASARRRAARLQRRLTALALRTAPRAAAPVELHVTREALVAAQPRTWHCMLQRGRDLGERMHKALSRRRARS